MRKTEPDQPETSPVVVPEASPEVAPAVEPAQPVCYQSNSKPQTVAKCPHCSKWAFYRDPNEAVRCGACRQTFKPADTRRAKVGDPSV
jgi:acetyl-CoA carboxylase beta subunit